MLVLANIRNVVLGAAAFLGGAFVSVRQAPDPTSRLTAELGWVDVSRRRQEAAELTITYRRPAVWAFRPFVGAMTTTSGALYGWAGIGYDMRIGAFELTPSFGPGLYRAGGGIDLGYPLEFRSQLSVAYQVSARSRIGVGFAHISNASLGARNPGTEMLTVGCSVLFGKMPPGR